jgi:endoglucanase
MQRWSCVFALSFALLAACAAGSDAPIAGIGGGTGDMGGGTGGGGGGIGDGGGGSAGAPGYLSTKGSRIVDSAGNPVRLTGLSWFGLETPEFAPHGLWARSLASMLDQVKSLGYNTLRIPYSNQLFEPSSVPHSIDWAKNPDLVGLSGLEILDRIVAGARARGLRIILDRHRFAADHQSELWYDAQCWTPGTCTEQRWISDWQMLAGRYAGDPTVIGVDLHNEPHGSATWGDGNTATDWRLAAERAGNAVLTVNPNLLVFVEGVENAGGASYWWGGNLRNAGAAPVRLSVPDRLVYSAHDYPATVYAQAWFSDPAYPANLPGVWDAAWGYLVKQGIAPVWIGEFGTRNVTTTDQRWLSSIAAYLGENGVSFAFWCLNADSGDTGGILQDDWATVNADKQAVLAPLLAPAL